MIASDYHIKLIDFYSSVSIPCNPKEIDIKNNSYGYIESSTIRTEGLNFTLDWYNVGSLLYECLTG